MKQKTITTDKATLLLVEIDDLQAMIGVEQGCIWYLRRLNNQLADKTIKLPQGNWQPIGRLPDITEEQADSVVLSRVKGGGLRSYPKDKCFKDYKNGGYPRGLTSLYSLKTLLQSNEVYFENPIPTVKERLEDWQEAQSKVWGKERTYLFIKVD